MAFREGTDVEQVHKFRALISKLRDLDAKVDSGTITIEEAWAEVAEKPKKVPKEKETT